MGELITPLLCWWVAMVERHAKATLFFFVFLTAATAMFSVDNFKIDSELDSLIRPSEKTQWFSQNNQYRQAFPDYQELALVVVSGTSAEETFNTAEKLYFSLKDSGKFEDVFAPAFEPFFQDHALYSIPTEGVKRLSEAVESTLPDLAAMYKQPGLISFISALENQYADANDLGVLLPEAIYQLDTLIDSVSLLKAGELDALRMVKKLAPQDTEDTHYQIISVKGKQDFTAKLPNKAIMNTIRATIATIDAPGDVQMRITGEAALMDEEVTAGIQGVEFASMLSIFLLAIILGVGVRSFKVIAGIFIMLLCGVMTVTVFTLVVFESFNTLSLVFLAMFFGLGVDFAVHYALRIIEMQRENGDMSKALHLATEDEGVALALCTLTSAIAFLSFLPTDYIGLAELGVISAAGMMVAFWLSLTFIPAWFKVLKIEPPKSYAKKLKPKSSEIKLRTKTVIFLVVAAAIYSGVYIQDLTFNYNLLAMRDENSEGMKTLAELQDNHVVTNYSISVMLEEGFDLEKMRERLLELESVSAVELPEDILPIFQEMKQQHLLPVLDALNALGDPGAIADIDQEQTLDQLNQFIAHIQETKEDAFFDEDLQKITQFEKALISLRDNPQLWGDFEIALQKGIQLDVEQLRKWFSAKPYGMKDLPDYIKRRFISEDGKQLIKVIPSGDMSVREDSDQFVRQVRKHAPNIAGEVVVEWGSGMVVIDSFRVAATIAIMAIFTLLMINFRKLSTTLLVFIPLLLVCVFTLAIGKSIGITLNMANILVIPLIFGLGVDTGIHVVHRYHVCSSLKKVYFSSTTKAVLISALTTVGTFFSISFSPHKGAASIGVLLTISLLLLLVMTFVVLPVLLSIFEPKEEAK